MTEEDAVYVRRERLVVALYVLCAMLLLAHFVHERWEAYAASEVADRIAHPDHYLRAYAPDVYRIGMPALLRWISRLPLLHRPTMVATFTDFVFGSAALYLGYLVAVQGMATAIGAQALRVIKVAFYLSVLLFPLFWVLPYQRPETLPTAFYLAAVTCALLRVRQSMAWGLLAVLVTALQALIRSDAPFVYGAAIFLLALTGDGLRDIAPRRSMLLLGAAIAGTAGAIQAYLQFVRFPHTPYTPGTPVVMLFHNLELHFLSTICVAMLPVVVLLAAAWMAPQHLRSTDRLAVLSSCLFFPLWLTVGSGAEVRIAVPFMLLLAPTASHILASILHRDETRAA